VERNDNKLYIVIAAKQFLYRFGIKTIMSILGLEPEILEAESFDKLRKIVKKNPAINFIILSEDILPSPKNASLEVIKSYCPYIKFLILGDEIIENCQCSRFVLNNDMQKEVLGKFHDFFFEPEIPDGNYNDNTLLSEREIDVLKLVAQGYSNKETADKLCISINTVITHRKNITDKLGIKTIAGLTVYAMMNNLISADKVKQ
jgi:DNA-binding CsgD family transcriptional regulator